MTGSLPPPADPLAALDDGAAALPFARAVVTQLARAPGAAAAPAEERRVAEEVAAVLRLARPESRGDAGPERAGERLAADATLLAAFFQNVDLLYDHGYRHADAVSLAVMHAVSLLEA